MPELPEVETIARKLKRDLLNRRITGIIISWAGTITGMDSAVFIQNVQDSVICDIWRRGKYLIMEFDHGRKLVIHLRMSGRFSISKSGEQNIDHKHTRVRMMLDNGLGLNFIDQRKFGRFYLVDDVDSITSILGPEPLSSDFTDEWFSLALSKRNGQIKNLLLNQRFLAGLGNIYANEALWHARIHPERRANTLNQAEIRQLHNAIIEVLQQAVKHGGTSLDDRQYMYPDGQLGAHQQHLYVYDRAGNQCERCGYDLKRIVQSQRSTYYCPVCQVIPVVS
jgi:formamidopyrimidine-DNA glycosylase